MGSPETCEKCGGVGRHVEGKRGFTRFPCPNATPTPPGAAPDAASGPKAHPRMPAPTDDHEERMACGHGLSRLVYACGACRPAPDAGAERAVVEAARALIDGTRRDGCLYCVCGRLMTGNVAHQANCAWNRLDAALRGTKGA